jgi:hypothetical protein
VNIDYSFAARRNRQAGEAAEAGEEAVTVDEEELLLVGVHWNRGGDFGENLWVNHLSWTWISGGDLKGNRRGGLEPAWVIALGGRLWILWNFSGENDSVRVLDWTLESGN